MPFLTGRSSTPRRPYGSNKEKKQSHPKMSNAETLVAALAKKNGIAFLQLDLMPLLSGIVHCRWYVVVSQTHARSDYGSYF